jgi:pyruvate dehydrogenase E2 component (dihydrolipoamide acetyltransferase)
MADLKLPELGENVTSADVLRVLVSAGETVTKDQPVLELETDKATVEVPSTVTGVVQEVKVKPGDKVKTGQVILTFGEDRAGQQVKADKPAAGAATGSSAKAKKTSSEPAAKDVSPAEAQPTVPPASPGDSAAEGESAGPGPAPARRPRGEVVRISRAAATPAPDPGVDDGGPAAAAAPSVRRLARELGVAIDEIVGGGPGGRISDEDVKTYARQIVSRAGTAPGSEQTPLPDFSRWGEIERKPMSGVRRKTAEHLGLAWSTIPHVTQHDRADLTQLDLFRKKYEKQVEEAGGALTVTAMLLKVVASALKAFPQVNSAVDMAAHEIIVKKYIHVGVAVDTDRGLLVPVIRDADAKNIVELSTALKQLAEKARAHKLALEEMQGGTFTITNLGGYGGTYFSPIVNWPEVAILGVSRASVQPVFVDGAFQPRLLLPLSLSYDHRVIDGADAVRFLRWIVEALEQPMLMSLQT